MSSVGVAMAGLIIAAGSTARSAGRMCMLLAEVIVDVAG